MLRLVISICFLGFLCGSVAGRELSEQQIDETVEKAMKAFQVPGVAVGIVKDGETVLLKGYGVRSIQSAERVDVRTVFGIASLSKAFTCAAIAMLVDDGKLAWSDRVVDHLPWFQLYDPYVTREFQIVDLVTHRSGLPLGAGDLMMFPKSDFQKREILGNLKFLKPSSSFRTKFDYDNLLYLVAGEIIAEISGKSWSDFVESRLLGPLGMRDSAGTFERLSSKANVISPHALVDGQLATIDRFTMDMLGPAGGIYSSVTDMAKWIHMLLADGTYGSEGDQRLLSEEEHWNLFQIKTLLPASKKQFQERGTFVRGYALGWFVSREFGFLKIMHTGGLPGNVCRLTLIPELNLGVIVLLNQESGMAMHAIPDQIIRAYLGLEWEDQVEKRQNMRAERKKKADAIEHEVEMALSKATSELPNWSESFEGTYEDDWYGQVFVVKQEGGDWLMRFSRTPQLTGKLSFYKGTTFVVRWNDRSLHADAFVLAKLDAHAEVVSLNMKAISPLTDFSYDFRHLELKKIASGSDH